MNKTLPLLLSALLLSAYAVLAVPTLSNPTPPSGSTINGNSTTVFAIQGNQTLFNGVLLFDGVFRDSLDGSSGTLNCVGLACSATYDISSDSEGIHFYQFSVDGGNSAVFTITINRPPSQPIGCNAAGYNESTLNVSCAPGESDIQYYQIYRNDDAGVNIGNASQFIGNFTLAYLDGFLQTGEDYFYIVVAVDTSGLVSPPSTEFSGVVLDMTPPAPPLFNPPSPAFFNTNSFTLNITYQENVSLFIYSGPTLVDAFPCNGFCQWNESLSNGTYTFRFEAFDPFGNMRSDPWTVWINQNPNETMNITSLEYYSFTKSWIRQSILPGGYWLIRYNWTMYPWNGILFNMTDIQGFVDVIDITSESQPIFFCENDYDPMTQDIIGFPVYNVVPMTNTGSMVDLRCPDTNPTIRTSFSSILKIPTPIDAQSDNYGYTLGIDPIV